MKEEIKLFKNPSGLTLIEIVVVMAILAVGATVAVWGMHSLVPDLHLKAAVRHLKSDMHLARLTAIKQNTFIVSEFNTDDNSYIIYIDDGGGDSTKANNYTLDEGEQIFKSVRMHPHVNMYSAKFGFVSGKFAFNSRGTLDGPAGGVYMYNKIKSFRGLAVSRIGKMTIKASADGSDWHRLN